MSIVLSKRVQSLKPSPTLALAAKAKELKSQGLDVISLSVGEPDWDTFDSIKAVAKQKMDEGHTKYTPASGLPELRQAIARQVNGDFSSSYTDKEVTVTAGGKFVIFSALQALIDSGDEVIVPAPYWVSYPTMVELAEGRPVILKCKKSNRFKLTASELEASITKKSKLLILNSPSNPSGEMYSKQELEELAQVLSKHPQLLILSDDIYNRLVFIENGLAPHLLMVAPELKSRLIVVNGISKTYSMTGWRLGWALAPEEVIGAMNKYQSQSVSCASSISQHAAIQAVENGEKELNQAIEVLRQRRDHVFGLIRSLSKVEVEEPQGAFYIWPDFSAWIGSFYKGNQIKGSREFAQYLLEDQMVAVVPGVEFGIEGFVRISYALAEARMTEAVNRIETFLSKLTST